MRIYCPSCGRTSDSELADNFEFMPGDSGDVWECPNCDTMFTFLIQYNEV